MTMLGLKERSLSAFVLHVLCFTFRDSTFEGSFYIEFNFCGAILIHTVVNFVYLRFSSVFN
jgi:hypothetical protein